MLAFRVGEERIQQVLSVAGNASEQFAIGVIIQIPAEVVERLAWLPSFTDFRINPYNDNGRSDNTALIQPLTAVCALCNVM